MTDLETQILELLTGRSPAAAVTREELVCLTGQSDRKNRDAVASLQSQGYPIINLRHGYYWGTQEEVQKYKNREWKRIRSLAFKLKNLFPKLHEAVEQLELGF